MKWPLVLAVVAVAGCTHDRNVGLLATQRLPVDAGKPIVLRAAHGGIVNLLDQSDHRLLYNGLVTTGDDVTLDPAAHTVKVRALVVSNDLRPGDVVQVTFD